MKIIKGQSHGHITPVKKYISILLWLFLLTGLTVVTAHHDLPINDWVKHSIGEWAPITLALMIAGTKASLVLMHFMHMKHETGIIWVYGIVLPIGIFLILITMTLIDGHTRHLL